MEANKPNRASVSSVRQVLLCIYVKQDILSLSL